MLATVMLKVSRNISPSIFSEIFYPRDVNYSALPNLGVNNIGFIAAAS